MFKMIYFILFYYFCTKLIKVILETHRYKI